MVVSYQELNLLEHFCTLSNSCIRFKYKRSFPNISRKINQIKFIFYEAIDSYSGKTNLFCFSKLRQFSFACIVVNFANPIPKLFSAESS